MLPKAIIFQHKSIRKGTQSKQKMRIILRSDRNDHVMPFYISILPSYPLDAPILNPYNQLCSLYRFAVSFVPAEACEHIINVSFNKMPVPGCPISVQISGGSTGPQVSLGGPGAVHLPNSLTINHDDGRLEDIEVNVEGKTT